MIELKKTRLPETIKVGRSRFKIHTDFKYILRFIEVSQDKNARLGDFDFIYIDAIPISRLEGIRQINLFINPSQEIPRRTGEETKEVVLDYTIDSDYIYAAFMEQYKIDLLTARLHWYQFTALLHGLHDTELNRIIQARLWRSNTKAGDYERQQQKQYEAWRLPQPEDNEPDEALDDFLKELQG
ncbi:MAG: bacteriophage Gp15 family protein [Bacteroidales bacterium]|nr:bacteriophage Gp15 family protein [Bacteroidales bacterium]